MLNNDLPQFDVAINGAIDCLHHLGITVETMLCNQDNDAVMRDIISEHFALLCATGAMLMAFRETLPKPETVQE